MSKWVSVRLDGRIYARLAAYRLGARLRGERATASAIMERALQALKREDRAKALEAANAK